MQQFLFPLLMIAMIGWMFYSQRNQQKKRMESLNSIQKGDPIVTIGGLHGIVDEIDTEKVVLDVDGIYLTFDRSAIRNKLAQTLTEKVPAESETATTIIETDDEIV